MVLSLKPGCGSQLQTSPFNSSAPLSKSIHFSLLQFSHLYGDDDDDKNKIPLSRVCIRIK